MSVLFVKEEVQDARRRELPVRIIFKKKVNDYVHHAVVRMLTMSNLNHITMKGKDIEALRHAEENHDWLSKREKDRTVVIKMNEGFDLNTFLLTVEPGIYLIEAYEGHF